jgi:hypothetical protein
VLPDAPLWLFQPHVEVLFWSLDDVHETLWVNMATTHVTFYHTIVSTTRCHKTCQSGRIGPSPRYLFLTVKLVAEYSILYAHLSKLTLRQDLTRGPDLTLGRLLALPVFAKKFADHGLEI